HSGGPGLCPDFCGDLYSSEPVGRYRGHHHQSQAVAPAMSPGTDTPDAIAHASESLAELATADVRLLPKRRTRVQSAWRSLRKAPPTAWFGLFIIAAYAIIAIFAPLIAPYGEADIVGDQYAPWDSQFLLGTDQLGRDMLSRLIFGARNT